MKNRSILRLIRFLITGLTLPGLIILVGCRPVKPWQRAYLNDYHMRMDQRAMEKPSLNFHSYREGASGGGKEKTGGGCGCN